ncbi:MAG: ABC-type polysaccharide/polyol phosphate export system, permease component [Ilumatobacteraceae bacterium]|nr:ABC-type polysaccharide/polyol phosphate export system, permease component [Ilumatobacteraceae bacterium]
MSTVTRTGSITFDALSSSRRPGRGRRLVERNLLHYKVHWTIIVSGFFEPLFYLLSIGVGVGKLVGPVVGAHGEQLTYRTFVAPALLASSAFNGALYDSTMNVFFKLKHDKLYDAVLATPMRVRDVAVGEITWALIRGLIYAVAFLIVMGCMGLFESWWAVLALPACTLIGFAFAATGMAATSYMRTFEDFEFITMTQLVLFLFSATFYPLSVYPRWMQVVVECSPLYHGVHLVRSLVLGDIGPDLLLDALYLAVLGLIGLTIANRRLALLLTP